MNTILIVGGGPAGSACGTLLARAGFDVTICEKATFPRDKICGECVNPRCWEFFELLGIVEEIRACQQFSVERVAVTNSKGNRISASVPGIPSKPFVAVKRSILDMILADNARLSGARVLEGCQVVNIERSVEWKVTARIHGSTSTFTSNILMGADGRNSIVAKKFSRKRGELKGPKRVAVQWHAPFQPDLGRSLEMFLFSSGYGGVVNVDERTSNAALVTTPELTALASKDFSSFLSMTLLSNPGATQVLKNLNPLSPVATTFPINPIILQPTDPLLYFVGDAHHTVEPFTGEGIYFALQDGISTALKILRKTGEFRKTPFWSNRVFSPVLRRPKLADHLITAAAQFPAVVPFGIKAIFH